MESKTKTAFTRKYNKDVTSLPYAVLQTVGKKAKVAAAETMGEEEDAVEEDDDEEEDDNVGSDAMIKVKKPKESGKDKEKGGGGKGGKGAGASGKGGKAGKGGKK